MAISIKCTQGELNTSGEYGLPDPILRLLVRMNLVSSTPTDDDMRTISLVSHLWNGEGSAEFLRLKLFSIRKSRRADVLEACDLTRVERYIYSTFKEAYKAGFSMKKSQMLKRIGLHFRGVKVSEDELKVLQRRARVAIRGQKPSDNRDEKS